MGILEEELYWKEGKIKTVIGSKHIMPQEVNYDDFISATSALIYV